jgi:hypothetical protein
MNFQIIGKTKATLSDIDIQSLKRQITAIETGILTFEGAFLGQILLGTGKTVLEHVEQTNMLPKLEGPKP